MHAEKYTIPGQKLYKRFARPLPFVILQKFSISATSNIGFTDDGNSVYHSV